MATRRLLITEPCRALDKETLTETVQKQVDYLKSNQLLNPTTNSFHGKYPFESVKNSDSLPSLRPNQIAAGPFLLSPSLADILGKEHDSEDYSSAKLPLSNSTSNATTDCFYIFGETPASFHQYELIGTFYTESSIICCLNPDVFSDHEHPEDLQVDWNEVCLSVYSQDDAHLSSDFPLYYFYAKNPEDDPEVVILGYRDTSFAEQSVFKGFAIRSRQAYLDSLSTIDQ